MFSGSSRLLRSLFAGCFLIASSAAAQQSTPVPASQIPTGAPSARPAAQAPPPPHAFWDRTNILLFSGVGIFRGLDYASTRNFQARGREEVLIPDDVVNNSAGFAALEAAGTATSVGLSYWNASHRTPQDRALDLNRPHRGYRLRCRPKLLAEVQTRDPLKAPLRPDTSTDDTCHGAGHILSAVKSGL